jgi:hypothetical protein
MDTQIDSTIDLRILTDDELDMVNGGSFWSDFIISIGSFIMTSVAFGIVGWIYTRGRP